MKKLIKFFDLLEDKTRARLSRHPLVYGIVSGIGIVMFYRGVWMVLDEMSIMTSWFTLFVAFIILMLSGVFVSQFVSNHIILSGIKKEKKLVERVAGEVKTDSEVNKEILDMLKTVQIDVLDIKKKLAGEAGLAKDEKIG